jgi:hypothetical protein
MQSKSFYRAVAAVVMICAPALFSQNNPRFPIGMNIPGNNYYSSCRIFTDVMKTANTWITYNAQGQSDWNTGKIDQMPLDSNGYPLELPYAVDGTPQAVRFLINNFYKGEFVFLHDGDGDFTFHSMQSENRNGRTYITLNGEGGHVWIQITRSANGNHVRNIRILPVAYENEQSYPLFDSLFVKGLKPFHCIRFMDWMHTNGSQQKTWADRSTPTYYSQGLGNGMAIEYAIDLANLLQADAWFCVPHAADDEYIAKFAQMVCTRLQSHLNVYVEYSNEVWNWQFAQAQWACRNGILGDAALYPADTLRDQLRQVGQQYCNNSSDDCVCHPEKDAHLMARVFKIWRSVFEAAGQAQRLTRTAAIQVGWCANTGRVLAHLATQGGCDAVSPTGYFNYTQADHDTWNANPGAVTAQQVVAAVAQRMDNPDFWNCVRTTADQAKEYGLKVVLYEAGQHMQPWKQGEWDYNQAVWDAQIHPDMYDMYLKYFRITDSIYTNYAPGSIAVCAAFSYVGERESRWGSWGHLEYLEQLNDMANIKTAAPKYAALLDMNTQKEVTPVMRQLPRQCAGAYEAGPATVQRLVIDNNGAQHGNVQSGRIFVYDLCGKLVAVDNTSRPHIRQAAEFPAGVYIMKVMHR